MQWEETPDHLLDAHPPERDDDIPLSIDALRDAAQAYLTEHYPDEAARVTCEETTYALSRSRGGRPVWEPSAWNERGMTANSRVDEALSMILRTGWPEVDVVSAALTGCELLTDRAAHTPLCGLCAHGPVLIGDGRIHVVVSDLVHRIIAGMLRPTGRVYADASEVVGAHLHMTLTVPAAAELIRDLALLKHRLQFFGAFEAEAAIVEAREQMAVDGEVLHALTAVCRALEEVAS